MLQTQIQRWKHVRPMVVERVYAGTVALWAVYLALAPVVYLFGLEEHVDLRVMKVGVCLAAALQTFALSLLSGRLGAPLWPMGAAGLALLAALMLPGAIVSGWPWPALDPMLDLILAAAVSWSFYRMHRDGWPVANLLRGVAAVVGVMAAIYVMHSLTVAPGDGGLCAWDPVEMHRLFGHSNAGWAASLAAFVALAAFLGMGPSRSARAQWWSGALLALLVAALVISGGRSGMLVAAGILLLASVWGIRWAAAPLLVLMALAVAVMLWQPECAQSDRTGNARAALSKGADAGLFQRVNTLLTGRMVGYVDAVEKIGERPLLGWGWRQVRVAGWQGNTPEVHNLYLKTALYCGVPAAAALAALVGWTFACWWRWIRRCDACERPLARAAGGVLLAGVGISMVEPGTLIGSFQYLSLWWVAAGLSMAGARVAEVAVRKRGISIVR